MQHQITIAIDGHSSCGKSTLAKALAKKLRYHYIDTGAMYRAVTLYMMQNKVSASNIELVKSELKNVELRFRLNPKTHNADMHLNGKNVEQEIRTMEVSKNVSQFSTIKEVREAMVAQQQEMGQTGGIVMDGRDIGTVVFPNAELKIFMTASPEVRAIRRHKELQEKGQSFTLDEVKNNLLERDRIDSNRAESPLKQANDARVLDSSNLTQTEQLNIAQNWVSELTLSA